jgi:S1-C subfamily serine protease
LRAALRKGNLLVAVNDRRIATVDDVHGMLAAWPIGEPLTVTVLRGASRLDVAVAPAELP